MTLTQITLETRAILKWAGIILAALLILFLVFKIKDALFPAPPPLPTVSFGKLPSIDFPQSVTDKNFSYSIDTISGTLPVFSSSEKVFKITETQPDLLSLTRAQELAKNVGFKDKPSEISENVYQWNDSETGRSLTMNILNYNFSLSTNFLLKSNLPNFKDTALAISTSKNFLQNMNLLPSDLDGEKTKTDFLVVKNYSLNPASGPSDSQIVRVSFYQKPFNNLNVYYPNLISPMNFIVGDNSQGTQILGANFFYQKVSDNFATYPTKTAQVAFEDLKKGKALITQAPTSSQVSIKSVNLGYYFSEKKQQYLMPVIVFEGDGFQAYVSAVRDEWVNK